MRVNLFTWQEIYREAIKPKNDEEYFGYYDGQIYAFDTLGHTVYISGKDVNNNRHILRDEKGRFVSEKNLRCPKCGKKATKEGHDPCLANLPGVTNACCGHGVTEGYIAFEDGTVIRGYFDTDEWLRKDWPEPK